MSLKRGKEKWEKRDRRRRKKSGDDMVLDGASVKRIQGDLALRRKRNEKEKLTEEGKNAG